jgi:hypothetical protein
VGAKPPAMRDLVVREALQTMARDAAKRFRELVAAGEEIPYDVREPGAGSPLAEYAPLTERFVREHALVLRELDSFGAACAAIEAADLAGPYLEQFGVAVPPEPRGRAELAGTVFLCRLWIGSTDFSLERDRLEIAIDELERNADAGEGEIEVIVPLRGLQMAAARLDLATAAIVRADTVEVPAEARASEGSGLAGWEPTFLAVTRVSAHADENGEQPDPGVVAVEKLRTLVTTLRLFKPGGVALGAHAWTRVGADRWRRIATGAGRPRPGGYRLTDSELGELAAFSRALTAPSTPFRRATEEGVGFASALARALSRFEAGLERNAVLEALNDYLLAMRFMLEGGGPADLGLPMRVAALCAEPERRSEVKSVLDRAVGLERELWSGEPASYGDAPTPAQTAGEVEDLLRAILKDAACGHLGSDLRATADEILLADGLAVGEGSSVADRGATAEWSLDDEDLLDDDEPAEDDELSVDDDEDIPSEDDVDDEELDDEELAADQDWAAQETQTLQVPDLRGRISVEQHVPEREEQMVFTQADHTASNERPAEPEAVREPSPVARLLERRSEQREAIAERVANLFPRPETTEWNVREISYDRSRRAKVHDQATG